MNEAVTGLVAATIRIATPLIFAGLGEMIIEKGGVLNLGIEGTMILGAFTGFIVTFATGWPLLGLLAAILVGALAGMLLGIPVVSLGLPQHVSGVGVTLLTSGLAFYGYRLAFGTPETSPQTETFKLLELGGIFRQYALTYIGYVLVPLLGLALKRTPQGLRLKAAGEDPEALDAAGVSVHAVRYKALALGGALIGAGGAFLSVAQLGFFQKGVVAGRGWVALALVIFGNWSPSGILAGALLFGGIEALQIRAQTLLGIKISHELFSLLPYLITVLALAFTKRGRAPKALLKPFPSEEERS